MRGREVRIETPRDAIRLEIGLVPEDRKRQGLVQSESGRRNMSLPLLDRLSRLTWVHQAEERELVREHFHMLRVRTPDIDAPVAGLSGGNQQKVVLARWLAARAKILILDEPTRGVDVGAKAEIHALIGELAAQGAAVLVISSELPELLSLSTRILVLRAGRLVGEVPGARRDAGWVAAPHGRSLEAGRRSSPAVEMGDRPYPNEWVPSAPRSGQACA